MDRLIDQLPLRRGAHPTRDLGMCAMEMVAWLAGEAHSDEPRCACPVLAALVRATNDALDDAQRNRLLRPLVPQLVNTRGSAYQERQRGLLVCDFLVRSLLPELLRRQRRGAEAELLANLPAVVDQERLQAAARAVEHYAPSQHAARWVLARATEDRAPARYVAGVVQVARALGTAAMWRELAALVLQLAAVGRAAPGHAPVD